MTAQTARVQPRQGRQLETLLTRDPKLVEAAQRLRYQVFSEEYGSDLGSSTPGIDADHFDSLCEHLMVRDTSTGALVATTRILHEQDAGGIAGLYSSGEFDLSRLSHLPGTLAELGRTCVHPDYRNGGTITMLWAAIAEYLASRNVNYLIGCASISMADGGMRAWRISRFLQENYLASDACRVTPHRSLPHLAGTEEQQLDDVPALIRAYMRLGARVCGEPCWDPDFRCADLLVLLDVSSLTSRYSRHFMRKNR